MTDITETAAYAEGKAWAGENVDRLRELYTGRELDTAELRSRLFREAERRYRPKRDSFENDLSATAWVAGAIRSLTGTMPMSLEGLAAVFDAALELGSWFGAESASHEALESLKGKPAGWWRRKLGDASPDDIMKAVLMRWWREVGEPQGRSKTSRAEALKHGFGARELKAFDTVRGIEFEKDGEYEHWWVQGADAGFDIMAKDVYQGSRLIQGAGVIVG